VNVSINRDEWLAAVRAVEPANDPDALTVLELCAILGTKRSATKERLSDYDAPRSPDGGSR
jgi:hypothetical protein